MNLILLAAQSSPALAGIFPERHSALLSLAGGVLLDHALDLLAEAQPARWFVTVGEHGAPLTAWLTQRSPAIAAQIIDLHGPVGFLEALSRSRDYLPGNEALLMVPAGGVLKAVWSQLGDRAAALVGGDPAVTCALYVPRADLLWPVVSELLAQAAAPTPGDLATALEAAGVAVDALPVEQWEDATTPGGLLQTNKRLLSVGYGSREALERSFAEGFAALPPVYLAGTAEVSSAVLGPYVSVGDGAIIEDAVVRNSIIAPGARVERCVLDGAIIGENGQVTGRLHALHTGDNTRVALD